jgi:pimeloyl-ACP methyl ester carboxylesterase
MADSNSGGPVTVVLVHGAFADGTGWTGVIERLQAADVPVRAVVNPLRGIAADSAYVASVFSQIPGRVLAVGHSYGGAVITNAAADADNVVGLVYVAAFAPDEGEALQDIEAGSTDSVLNDAIRPSNYPDGPGEKDAVEFSIDPASFHRAFAGDLSEKDAAVMAAAQRPVAAAAFGEKNGPAAWKNVPSWAVVATGDKAAGADVVLSMARRAGAEITEVEGSHVIMISQPQVVTDTIMNALRAVALSVDQEAHHVIRADNDLAAARCAGRQAQAHGTPAQCVLDSGPGDRSGAHRDSSRCRIRMAHPSRRRGWLHPRGHSADDDRGRADPHPARRRPVPDPARHAAQRAGHRPGNGPHALHLHRRTRTAAGNPDRQPAGRHWLRRTVSCAVPGEAASVRARKI